MPLSARAHYITHRLQPAGVRPNGVQPALEFSSNRYFRATSLDPGPPPCYIQFKVGPSTIQGRTKGSPTWRPLHDTRNHPTAILLAPVIPIALFALDEFILDSLAERLTVLIETVTDLAGRVTALASL